MAFRVFTRVLSISLMFNRLRDVVGIFRALSDLQTNRRTDMKGQQQRLFLVVCLYAVRIIGEYVSN